MIKKFLYLELIISEMIPLKDGKWSVYKSSMLIPLFGKPLLKMKDQRWQIIVWPLVIRSSQQMDY